MANVLIVLGMHRSGTSAVAGVLNALGYDFGPKLLAAIPGVNDKGFWEHADIVKVHDRLLGALGGSWHDPRPLPDGWVASRAARIAHDDILAIVRRDFWGTPAWSIKDPRLCRLLPLWHRVFADLDVQPRFLLCHRNPYEVAASIAHRDGFSVRRALILWLIYLLEAEKNTRGHARVVVSYEGLLGDWMTTMTRAASRLKLSWPVPLAQAAAEVGTFLEPGLRHHHNPSGVKRDAGETRGWIEPWAEVLDTLARRPSVDAERHATEVAAQIDAAYRVLGPELSARGHEAEVAQLFTPQDGVYSEERSQTALFRANTWERVVFKLPPSGSMIGPLRFDPCAGPGLVLIADISLRATGGPARSVFDPGSGATLDGLSVGGSARRLGDGRGLVLLSFGGDPQVILPPLVLPGGPSELEVRLKVERMPAAVASHASMLREAGDDDWVAVLARELDMRDATDAALRDQLQVQATALGTEIGQTRSEAMQQTNEVTRVRHELQLEETLVAQLQAQAVALRAENGQAQAELSRVVEEAERARVEAVRKTEEVRRVWHELQLKEGLVSGLQAQAVAARVEIGQAYAELARLGEEASRVRENLAFKDQRIAALQLDALRTRLHSMRPLELIGQIRRKAATRQRYVSRFKAEAVQLAAEVSRLRSALDDSVEADEIKNRRIAELQAQMHEADLAGAGLRAQIAFVNRQRDQVLTSDWWVIGTQLAHLRATLAPRGSRRGAAAASVSALLGKWGAGPTAARQAAAETIVEPASPPAPRLPEPDAPATPESFLSVRPAAIVKPFVLLDVEGASASQLAGRLRFDEYAAPVVSVIVPVLNKLEFTLRCLMSLVAHPQDTPFEVIVVDDGSSDATAQLLPKVENLRYLRNATNIGFVRSINRGAAAARGEYLLFLNNDTEVQEHWLDPLVHAFSADPRTGIAGSKLVYPSGHLQEAGVVLRKDGCAELVGLNDDPAKPEYNRKREVDHCSGASLLIPRGLFSELGRFDEAYVPAYFEDCDLSLKVRRSGRKVVYVPDSVVVHHLSVTASEADDGFKKKQIEKNRETLLERWGSVLAEQDRVRAIAFYLPQYHPIPENDAWWGKGFTEWRYVPRARPVFQGHYQPRLPADLGFYDLRLPEAREAQAEMARRYGLHGFCYYYYWFNGKRLLERPLAEVLQSGNPDFPFCVCWANENWTRRWDGRERDVLIAQKYSPQDDRAFIEALLPYFADRRYIRVDGRPLLLVYRAELFPDVRATLLRWRGVSKATGLGDLYLVTVQSFDAQAVDPRRAGFDAAVEFPPHGLSQEMAAPGKMIVDGFTGRFYDYGATARNFLQRPMPPYPFFRTVMPSWDNTPRRPLSSDIFANTSPELYEQWLRQTVDRTRQLRFGDERIVFINAWNEWGEGNYLEPDQHYGHAWLEATQRALGLGQEAMQEDVRVPAAVSDRSA